MEQAMNETKPDGAASAVERLVGGDWVDVGEDDLPTRWDACKDFRVICSNGFVGRYGLDSALEHKPWRWPQCFPDGEHGGACCTLRVQKRITPNDKLKGEPRSGESSEQRERL